MIAVDPIAMRRQVARALGADQVLDPAADDGDAGWAIRRLTGTSPAADQAELASARLLGGYREEITDLSDRGVDVAIEVSGSTTALQQAIRATRFGGTICVLSYYGAEAAGLRLGEEFHINQLQLISARAQSLPLRDAPAWTLGRLVETAFAWLVSGRLQTSGIITPVVPFAESAAAYREIDEHPERSIKLGISFP
ncbi:MAG: zinc-binding dehydrogenase [Chloroflexota bacterium]|nr:zinc-binding dehydrogenase [Chloroflexota bacterium]